MQPRALPHLALMTAMFIWSTSYIALKTGLSAYTPLELMAWRMTVAALVFAPLWPRIRRSVRAHGRRKLLLLMLLCEPCLYFTFETHALRYTSASQAGMIVAMLPVTVSAAAWFVLRERVSACTLAGFAMAVGGVLWLSLGAVATENAPAPLLGNTLEALGMCCATIYTISLKRLSEDYTPMQLTALQSLAGMIFFTLFSLLAPTTKPLALGLDLPAWAPPLAVLYLGGCVTFGGYGLYNYGVSRLPAGQATAYTNLIPVLTLLLGVVLLREVFLPSQYAASCLVVAGVLLSQRGGRGKGGVS